MAGKPSIVDYWISLYNFGSDFREACQNAEIKTLDVLIELSKDDILRMGISLGRTLVILRQLREEVSEPTHPSLLNSCVRRRY